MQQQTRCDQSRVGLELQMDNPQLKVKPAKNLVWTAQWPANSAEGTSCGFHQNIGLIPNTTTPLTVITAYSLSSRI